MEDTNREIVNRETLPENFELLKARKTVWRLKFGQHVELLNCNGQIRVAHIHAVCGRRLNNIVNDSVMRKCDSPGYVILKLDEDQSNFPIHLINVFMYPIGYSN